MDNPKLKYLEDVPWDSSLKLSDGKTIHNLEQLPVVLMFCDDSVFESHVNTQKNDFANWIRDVVHYPELADKVSTVKTKDEFLKIMEQAMIEIKQGTQTVTQATPQNSQPTSSDTPPSPVQSSSIISAVQSATVQSSPVQTSATVQSNPVSVPSEQTLQQSGQQSPLQDPKPQATSESIPQTTPIPPTTQSTTQSIPPNQTLNQDVRSVAPSDTIVQANADSNSEQSKIESTKISDPNPIPASTVSMQSAQQNSVASDAPPVAPIASAPASVASTPASDAPPVASPATAATSVVQENVGSNTNSSSQVAPQISSAVPVQSQPDILTNSTPASALPNSVPVSGTTAVTQDKAGQVENNDVIEEIFDFEEIFKVLISELDQDVLTWDTQSN